MGDIGLQVFVVLIGLIMLFGALQIIKELSKKVFTKQNAEILLIVVLGIIQICTFLMPIAIIAIAIKFLF